MKNNNSSAKNIDRRISQDAVVNATIADNRLSAYIYITPPVNGGMPASYQDIAEALSQAGIIFGIREDTIQRLAMNPRYNRMEKAAEALMPLPGEDARLEYHFEATRDRRPKELDDGSVDYKDLGISQNVRAGDVLCTKIPATRGIAGRDVTGQEIQAPFGKDIRMPAGKNTQITEHGTGIIANIDGNVDLVKKTVVVMDVFEVKGDVGIETGNIDSICNVVIRGNVNKGYYVHTEGNIIIQGCIEGGEVIAGGNIFVEQGIIGMNSGRIECGGDLRCKYIQNANAAVEVNFEAGSCIQANIKCGGNARLIGAASTILASHLTVRHQVECINVGSEGSQGYSVLEIGADPYIVGRFVSIPKELKEVEAQITKLERLVDLFNGLDAQGRLGEDRRAELENLTVSRDAYRKKQGKLIMERAEVEQRMISTGYGTVKVTGTAYAGTLIIMGVEKKKLTSDYTYTMFTRTSEGIVTGPART